MKKYVLHAGRPDSMEGRLPKEIRSYDLLDSLSIPYEQVDHEETATIEACAAVDEVLETEICKNLFLCNAQATKFYLLMLPGYKKFKTKVVSKLLGVSRLSFAKPEYMEKFLDITPGSVSILGLMNDKEHQVQLILDQEVLDQKYIACHPCINTSSLRFETKYLDTLLDTMEHTAITISIPSEDDLAS